MSYKFNCFTGNLDLVNDTVSPLPIANGGTNASSQTTNGITYFDSSKITSGSNVTYNGTQVEIINNGTNATQANAQLVLFSNGVDGVSNAVSGISFTSLDTGAAQVNGGIYSSWYGSLSLPIVAGMTFVSPRDISGGTAGGVSPVNWGFRFDKHDGTTVLFVDTSTGNLKLSGSITDASALQSIDANNRVLHDNSGNSSMDWSGTNGAVVAGVASDKSQLVVQGHSSQTTKLFKVLASSTAELFTVDNASGVTFAKATSNSVINLGSGILTDTTRTDTTSIDYGNRTLYDSGGLVGAVDWQNRLLKNAAGTNVVNFSGTNPALIAPALGTPVSGDLTNCTGTASGLTAGHVTTNADLTGPITSSGNATSIASQTGLGTKFVVDTSPTIVTPALSGATTVTGIADAVQLIVKGNGTQTGNVLEVKNSANVLQVGISKTGQIQANEIFASGTGDIVLTTYRMYNSSGAYSVDWGNSVLSDDSQVASVSWKARLLKNSSGTTTIDYSGTNPTLTAPALGTPVSGVLTNCTGTASGLTAGGNLLKANGDIDSTSFSAANNTAVAANVTGLTFANATVRSFEAIVSIYVNASSSLYEQVRLNGIQRGSDWQMSQTGIGDASLFIFTITTAGQVQYTNGNYSGFSAATLKFRAITTAV